ncbi:MULTISPECIES: tail protein X [unclassified Mesorhizobium]|uniref:Tail protein X n=1 Tax=Mesorhizobium argentiipisi TaxID=3015175 RepID=A0ABU8KBT8_9HYPH|nr:tail protein X [Mesorhizobium sp.]RWF64951.1 MAG: phage tail protein [Mesorhizobium sp.]TIT42643.1 MAG: phage tail protein [Mesorhizobium sp.]
MNIYRASDGDMVDEICWRFYEKGQQPLAVERVYDANQGLAKLGPVLPAGTIVKLPDLPRPQTTPIIRIWG